MEASRSLAFFRTVGQLKTLKRTGWVNHNIPLPESVADHMYRMSMMTFLLVDKEINRDRLMKICMVHDLAESIVGDITPDEPISKDEKRKLEEDAMKKIVTELSNGSIGKELMDLWLEYEEGDSKEAKLAKELDKFEMIVQADEYEEREGKKLQTFFDSTASSFSHPEIVAWVTELRERRKKRWEAEEEALLA